jgi:hypothetical protein
MVKVHFCLRGSSSARRLPCAAAWAAARLRSIEIEPAHDYGATPVAPSSCPRTNFTA